MTLPRLLRRRSLWAAAGALCGAVLAGLLFVPAAWLAQALADATGGRLVLADPRGTVWNGSATVVLLGGRGSSAAASLPGRLSWRLRVRTSGFELRARQACCLHGEQRLRIVPGLAGFSVRLLPPRGAPETTPVAVGQLPVAVFSGLGAPWNTVDPGGLLRLTAQDLSMTGTQGRLAITGRAELRAEGLSSGLAPVPALGDYVLVADAAAGGSGSATITLTTLRGPLQLSGTGQAGGASPMRFRGQARADAGSEGALDNLLNVIGRRQGAVSNLSIG